MAACSKPSEDNIVISVGSSPMGQLDDRLFGQFLEKPSWGGEIGPEAALKPGTHEFQDSVVDLMKAMNIPILRFPGCTDINHHDWTTMIDNVPGRNGGRPTFVGHQGDTVNQLFGYDEALRLAEELKAEMIIVPNFGDAYFGRKPLKEAVLHEMGLIAYCNAELGAALPEGMRDWPTIRAKNGHPEPYKVKYVQLVNEPWVMDRGLHRPEPIDSTRKMHYFECLKAFIDGVLSIDPDIQIIVDGNSRDITLPIPKLFGDQVDFLAYHTYMPWGINEIKKGDSVVSGKSLTEREKWLAWVSVPRFDGSGMSVLRNPHIEWLRELPYPIAITEWNWNGWWATDVGSRNQKMEELAKGIGAAGYLHAFMREGNQMKMGIQSMLVGNSWGIMGIRVSPEETFTPHMLPTGMVTSLYSRYHGTDLLSVETRGCPVYNQPYGMSGIQPAEGISYVDAVATASSDSLYLHVINRDFDNALDMEIEIGGEWNLESAQMTSVVLNKRCNDHPLTAACFNEQMVLLNSEKPILKIPSKSVSVIRMGRH